MDPRVRDHLASREKSSSDFEIANNSEEDVSDSSGSEPEIIPEERFLPLSKSTRETKKTKEEEDEENRLLAKILQQRKEAVMKKKQAKINKIRERELRESSEIAKAIANARAGPGAVDGFGSNRSSLRSSTEEETQKLSQASEGDTQERVRREQEEEQRKEEEQRREGGEREAEGREAERPAESLAEDRDRGRERDETEGAEDKGPEKERERERREGDHDEREASARGKAKEEKRKEKKDKGADTEGIETAKRIAKRKSQGEASFKAEISALNADEDTPPKKRKEEEGTPKAEAATLERKSSKKKKRAQSKRFKTLPGVLVFDEPTAEMKSTSRSNPSSPKEQKPSSEDAGREAEGKEHRKAVNGHPEKRKSKEIKSPAPLAKEPPKEEPPKEEPPKQEPPKQEPPKQEPPREEPRGEDNWARARDRQQPGPALAQPSAGRADISFREDSGGAEAAAQRPEAARHGSGGLARQRSVEELRREMEKELELSSSGAGAPSAAPGLLRKSTSALALPKDKLPEKEIVRQTVGQFETKGSSSSNTESTRRKIPGLDADPSTKKVLSIISMFESGVKKPDEKSPRVGLGRSNTVRSISSSSSDSSSSSEIASSSTAASNWRRASGQVIQQNKELVNLPQIHPPEGRFKHDIEVFLSSKDPLHRLIYTLDGSDPSPGAPTTHVFSASSHVPVTSSLTFKARAVAPDGSLSRVAVAAFTIVK